MRRVLFVLLILGGGLGIQPAAAEVFSDNFNRADGPLGPPWELLDQSLLYIQDQRVVAHANEYGLMLYGEQCPDCYCAEVALLANMNFSSNTDYDGRFQFFLGGGEEETSYWGFIAKLGLDEVSLWSYDDANGEIELQSVPSPLVHDFGYAMALYYDPVGQAINLLVADAVDYVVNLSVPAYSDPFCLFAIGIENLDATGDTGWIDNVNFEYCCDPTAAPDLAAADELVAWPRPFAGGVQLRANTGHESGRVRIFDIAGRQVEEISLRNGVGRWDGRNHPAGIYLARIAGSREAKAVRLIKLH